MSFRSSWATEPCLRKEGKGGWWGQGDERQEVGKGEETVRSVWLRVRAEVALSRQPGWGSGSL